MHAQWALRQCGCEEGLEIASLLGAGVRIGTKTITPRVRCKQRLVDDYGRVEAYYRQSVHKRISQED